MYVTKKSRETCSLNVSSTRYAPIGRLGRDAVIFTILFDELEECVKCKREGIKFTDVASTDVAFTDSRCSSTFKLLAVYMAIFTEMKEKYGVCSLTEVVARETMIFRDCVVGTLEGSDDGCAEGCAEGEHDGSPEG